MPESAEYVRENYNVPACVGRLIMHRGRAGIIVADRGNYIGVNFDDDKPGHVYNVHPTDDVEYGQMGEVRPLSRGQQRYRDYINADTGLSFAEWMGFKT